MSLKLQLINCHQNIRVEIIQPLIPEYRVALFRRLAEHSDLRVKVCASKIVPDIQDLYSVDMEKEYADLNYPCLGLMGNRFLWQRGLRLDPDMERGDVLVVCGNMRYLSNIPLILKAKRRKIGVLWWGHGFSEKRCRFKDLINRIIMHFIDARLLYTDLEVEAYKRLGLPANKLFATNNAIDQEPIKKAKTAWGGDRLKEFQRREKIEGKYILLFCGRRTKTVSLELVFSVLAQLKKSYDKYLFVIIGPDDSGRLLGEKAKELGVEDCIRWLGPIFEQHELAPWFLSARCFVFPGAIGLSIIHAFSYGLPVIVPNCIHGPEIVALRDGENGFFYKDGNADDLREKITAIIDHPEYYKMLSAKALQAVEDNYNLDNMVVRYVAAIKAVSQQMFNTL